MILNINGHNYKVNYVEGLFINEGQWGKTSAPSLTIDIDADLITTVAGETTMHEVLEALNFWQNWELNHHLLTQINASLYGVLNTNKHLVTKLFFPEKKEKNAYAK